MRCGCLRSNDSSVSKFVLTAEDVLRQEFPRTRFREGYDQDAVDDFLDMVVSSMDALTRRTEEAEKRGAEAERKLFELGLSRSTPSEAHLDNEPEPARGFRSNSLF